MVANQHGRAIFAMSVSYHDPEAGVSHQAADARGAAARNLPDARAIAAKAGPASRDPGAVLAYFGRERPIELRPVEVERYLRREPREPRFHVWLRAAAPLPDDPAIHRAVLAYASDMTLLDATLIAHGQTVFDGEIQSASLDHALWFHRPFRADEWLLYAQDSPSAGGARGFARGLIYSRDGTPCCFRGTGRPDPAAPQ